MRKAAGGFGTIWKSAREDSLDDRPVDLKNLKRRGAEDSELFLCALLCGLRVSAFNLTSFSWTRLSYHDGFSLICEWYKPNGWLNVNKADYPCSACSNRRELVQVH
jgi:hypothetical protein